MKIGTYYRLPNGEKGICVDVVSEYGIFSYMGKYEQRTHEEYSSDEVTPWREPRKWEVEVLVICENNDEQLFYSKSYISAFEQYELDDNQKIKARATVIVMEE